MRSLSRYVGAIAILMVIAPQPAEASEAHGAGNGTIIVTDESEAQPGRDGTGQPGRTVFGYWKIIWAAGGWCRDRRYTYSETEKAAYDYAYNRQVAEANGLEQFPECPADAAPPPSGPSPGQLARDFWDVRHLPVPTVEVQPDYALAGKRVYLSIKGPPSTAFAVPNPIGEDVAIAATSTYVVDWGDGSTPTTTTSQGGPWPDGDVTHVYDHAGSTATITVAQVWSATWSAGAAGTAGTGTLDNLRTTGTVTLPIRQLQAVRNR
jgi:hypothetical protein